MSNVVDDIEIIGGCFEEPRNDGKDPEQPAVKRTGRGIRSESERLAALELKYLKLKAQSLARKLVKEKERLRKVREAERKKREALVLALGEAALAYLVNRKTRKEQDSLASGMCSFVGKRRQEAVNSWLLDELEAQRAAIRRRSRKVVEGDAA